METVSGARWAVVYRELRSQILSLEIAPGSKLAEATLASTFGVSATPVRDALGRLCQEGLVQVGPGHGYHVAPLTVSDVAELCDLRFTLEIGAVRFAIERVGSADISYLRELSTRTGDTSLDAASLIQANIDFHLALAGTTGNQRLVSCLATVMESSTRFFRLGLSAFAEHPMQVGHDLLIDAIEARDLGAAIELCREEAYGSSERILAQLVRGPAPSARDLGMTAMSPSLR
jgi:DNA-binding GntR family transcriptional regulator